LTRADDVQTDALESARRQFRDCLVEAELLIPMGIDGLYGRGAVFERVIDGIEKLVSERGRAMHGDKPKTLRFPPVFSREAFERTDYVASFPNLTGAISTFAGGDKEHQALLADREARRSWDGHLETAGTMLVPAACHPSYAALPPVMPDAGQLMDIYGYCFRHEPAIDPLRMQAFRMHEFVIVGTPDQAQHHRDTWLPEVQGLLDDLLLEAVAIPANDPFFGRAGRMLAANQKNESLKTELTVRIYGDLDDGTAVASLNCHRDHFGDNFGLSTSDGAVAHSACTGFGVERIALALLRRHGLDPASWPSSIRTRMDW
jgi:seryl-tRNA synthetase